MPRYGSIESGFITALVSADNAETAQEVLFAKFCVELPDSLPEHAKYDYDTKTFISVPPIEEGEENAAI
jgi:hypothetical protein